MAAPAPILDLTPGQLDIKFQRGSTLSPILYYLGPALEVVNLSSASAKMQAKAAPADTAPLEGFDLTTQNGGLLVVQGNVTVPAGTALPDGTVTDMARTVAGAWGIQLSVLPAVTAAVAWAQAVYDCDIVLGEAVIPLAKGKLIATPEITP